jgi:hypothetical protein
MMPLLPTKFHYFVTVIAMNPANDASKAVCSDGVTIVTTKPSVKNVVLNGAKTDPRLVCGNLLDLEHDHTEPMMGVFPKVRCKQLFR